MVCKTNTYHECLVHLDNWIYLNLNFILKKYLQVVYENTAYSEFDKEYVWALVRNVLHNIYTDSSGTLVLGTVAIPTPPANVGELPFILPASA